MLTGTDVRDRQCRPESPLFEGFENSISVEAGQVEVTLEPLTLYDTAVVMVMGFFTDFVRVCNLNISQMSLIEVGRPLSRPGSLPDLQRQESYALQPSTEAPSPSTSFKAMFGGAIIRLLANPLTPVITASLGNVAGAYSRFSVNTQEFTFTATSISMEVSEKLISTRRLSTEARFRTFLLRSLIGYDTQSAWQSYLMRRRHISLTCTALLLRIASISLQGLLGCALTFAALLSRNCWT